jgi:L-cysteine desulfidase
VADGVERKKTATNPTMKQMKTPGTTEKIMARTIFLSTMSQILINKTRERISSPKRKTCLTKKIRKKT